MGDARYWTRSTLALLETVPDAVVVVDAAGVIVYANRLMEEMFGYNPDALVGRPVEVLVPDASRGRHRQHRVGYTRAPAARPMGSGSDLLGLHRSGRVFPVDTSLSPIETDEGRLIIAAVRDMSERRHIESALRQVNEKLGRELVAAAKDPEVPAAGTAGRNPGHRLGVDIRALREARRRQLQRFRDHERPGRPLHARRDRTRHGGGAAIGSVDPGPRLDVDRAGSFLAGTASPSG